MIANGNAVIIGVMLNKLMIRNLTLLVSISLMGCNHQASEVQEFAAQQKPSSGTNSATTNEVAEGDGKPAEQSWPELSVLDVSPQGKANAPLKVRFSIKSDGATPLVLEQNQISVHLFDRNDHSLFLADAVFANHVPDPIKIGSGQTVEFLVGVSADRFDKTKTWDKLPDGRYVLKLYVNSGKEQDFEFQWLGQTYSNKFPIKLPME